MNFSDKLQKLRKENDLTQEQLAEKLYVSRTAVSKWENGRGYPNIDSLQVIAKVFSITIDDLLSNDEIIFIAKEEKKSTAGDFIGLSFSIIDLMSLLFIFLPLYRQVNDNYIKAVNLLELIELPLFIIVFFYTLIGLLIACGTAQTIICLIKNKKMGSIIQIISITVGSIALLLFILTLEPYAACLIFLFLAFKIVLIIRGKSL